jgi:RNA polymerase sigma-70 factor, ECF subfamily
VPILSEIPSHEDFQSGDPLSYALLTILEKLNPVERAAFILRRAFDFPYREIAEICNLPEENARQVVHRAQEKLQRPRVRYQASIEESKRLLDAFIDACSRQDATTLKELLHRDVIIYSDGGGKVPAALIPLHGPVPFINFLKNVVKGAINMLEVRHVMVNGSPGVLFIDKSGRIDTICTLETDEEKITGLFFQRNPEKIFLQKWSQN